MCRTLICRVARIDGGMVDVESQEGVMTLNALAYPEMSVGDYVLAQARLILGVISAEEAQQLLAAEQELLHLFDELADEDENEDGEHIHPPQSRH